MTQSKPPASDAAAAEDKRAFENWACDEFKTVHRRGAGYKERDVDTAWLGWQARSALASTPAAAEPSVMMKPMVHDDGRKGWYIDHPEFFCDIEPDAVTGQWSVFFRDRQGCEGFAMGSAPPVPPAEASDLLQIAREIEELKRECSMDPESPQAIRNAQYMSIAYRVRALASLPAPVSSEVTCSRCNGSGDQEYLVGGGPDAHDEIGPCSGCGGTGAVFGQPTPWQPIETAPKTSKARLVWCPERQNTYVVTWDGRGWRHFDTGSWPMDEEPSHWMHLPAAPAPKEAE